MANTHDYFQRTLANRWMKFKQTLQEVMLSVYGG